MRQFDSGSNPWLSIPPEDYEGHMNSPEVDQLSALNHIFQKALDDVSPKRLAVLGCGTGNGFEHINPQNVERVLGIDINPKYLSILTARYGSKLEMLELSCSDLNTFTYPENSFDLLYAALIFEYVDVDHLVKRSSKWLKMSGTLVAVLQLPSSQSEMISNTPFPSLRKLGSIMQLINPKALDAIAQRYNLRKLKQVEIPLKSGKKFLAAYYTRLP